MKKNIKLTSPNHKALKILAAQTGKTMEDLANEILRKSISRRMKRSDNENNKG